MSIESYDVTIMKRMRYRVEARGREAAELLAKQDAANNEPPEDVEAISVTDVIRVRSKATGLLVVMAFAASLAWGTAAWGQAPIPGTRQELHLTVRTCVRVTRQFIERLGYQSVFDAYVRTDEKVSYFGTPTERFQFEKCMSTYKWPLVDVVPQTRPAKNRF